MTEVVCEFDKTSKLRVSKVGVDTIEIQILSKEEYVTLIITADDYLKLRVLEASKEFLDIGLAF